MAIPVPHTWTAGDSATSANLQTLTDTGLYLLGSATSGGSKKPVFRGRQTIAQSLATSGTFFSVTLDTEDDDYDNSHSTTTNTSRFTAATAGRHAVFYGCGFTGNATGSRLLQLAANGTALLGSEFGFGTVPNAGHVELVGSFIVNLNVNDYLEMQAMQSSGGALNTFLSGSIQPFMHVYWLSN